ncbi:hypothetical protein H2198_004695 [Neophaeococcomyces mojaviensis]|uniref:Uncharacterized protein n=1 Tax=Neophaeococcomyces mojaviensis TaxID=3383035 RepID=A0ACC3A8K6_9EURO|nr:hypothetical protein H2198_004695 [Knufia sp. JES_112]
MASASGSRRSHADYTVGCICPMGVELAPVEAMLDKIHEPLPTSRDQNAYTLGDIGGHNVVITVMPKTGNNVAATVATQLLNDFPSIRFGLLVGIGGGVPGEADARLGDVVVSQPKDTFGGVVQYDLGKRLEGGKFERTGLLREPPAVLSANVRKLEAQHRRLGHNLSRYISEMLQKYPAMQDEYSFPVAERDQLFVTAYKHQLGPTCDQCDEQQTVPRPDRPNNRPKIHYGTIGSANVVVKDATLRDELHRDMHILCVEMEAAGLMNDFPCLVIRGICDYADSHKNKKWQPYAAAVAAAYMKELLATIPTQEVAQIGRAVKSTASPFKLGLHFTEAPVIESDLFIGRLSELDKMDEILRPPNSPQEHHRLVLGGMGGIGKTQLAIAYARRQCYSYESIFWLNATSEAGLKQSLRLMAQRILEVEKYQELDDDQILLHISRWLLDTRNTRWLLIFDNYDEPSSYDIRKYCPYGAHGSAIITTRLPDQVGGQLLPVRPIENIEQSLEILETRSKRDHVKTDLHARRLAERMQGLPLALATAGAYLHKSTWTFERYLQEYERRWNINPRRPLQLREYQDRTLYTTWNMSYGRLKEEDTDAARLLKLLAYFDNQRIWFELMHAGITNNSPEWLVVIIGDASDFESAMRMLADYCFVELQLTTQSYSMHACVHDWTLAGLNQNVESWSYWYAFDCVASSISRKDWNSLGQVQYAHLAPHAVRLTHTNFNKVGEIISDDRMCDAEYISQLLQEQVRLGAAGLMYERALAGREKALGAEHTSTLDTVNNLGVLYYNQGKLEKAEQMCMRALAGREKALGAEHTSTLDTVNNLGVLYRNQGKLEKAEQTYMRALAGKEKALGAEHTSTLNTIDNLGILYWNQGKLEKAEQMYIRALAGKEKALGAEHTSTLDTVNNLGVLYRNQGKLEKAEQMYMRALAGKEKALGAEHSSTLDTVNNLGSLYRK